MDTNAIQLSLADRDRMLQQVDREIARKEKYIVGKSDEVARAAELNGFLADVQKDYQRYSTAILEERRKQKAAMRELAAYVGEVAKAEQYVNEAAEEATRTQDAILQEIEEIRGAMPV